MVMRICIHVLAMAGGSVEVVRMAVILIGRCFWRTLSRARLVAIAGGVGNKIRFGSGVIVRNPGLISCGAGVSIGDNAELLAEPLGVGAEIKLGNNVKIGKRCQLAANPGVIRIGDHASLHSNVVLLGHVSIGRYTLLSANIFASSGNHTAFDSPHRLIRDQDLAAIRVGCNISPVVIEEDCWIGWGVVIMRGVHIGRGAVVGANAVVTKDVEPYEVVVGSPARVINKRLQFSPKVQINAGQLKDGPYLYRGFLQSEAERRELTNSYPDHVGALEHTIIILSGELDFTRLLLRGITLKQKVTLIVGFEGIEYVIVLPEIAGTAFEQDVVITKFHEENTIQTESNIRRVGVRTFSLTAIFPSQDIKHPFKNLPMVWALHSATLKN